MGDSWKLKEALGACKNSVVLFSNLDILRYPKNIHIENLRVHWSKVDVYLSFVITIRACKNSFTKPKFERG